MLGDCGSARGVKAEEEGEEAGERGEPIECGEAEAFFELIALPVANLEEKEEEEVTKGEQEEELAGDAAPEREDLKKRLVDGCASVVVWEGVEVVEACEGEVLLEERVYLSAVS